jgi:hypothetical protein
MLALDELVGSTHGHALKNRLPSVERLCILPISSSLRRTEFGGMNSDNEGGTAEFQ